MIDCLVGHIGMIGIQDSPTSDIYLNDFPGITTERLKIIREQGEDDGLVDAWEKIEAKAIRDFESDLKFHLKKYFQNYTAVNSGITGYIDDNTIANHGSGYYSGFLFDLTTYVTSLKLEINDARIYLASAANFNIKIFDANTGVQLYSQAVVGVEGINTIKINYAIAAYKHNKVWVVYDTVVPIRAFPSPHWPGALSQGRIPTGSAQIASNLDASETGIMLSWVIKCGIDEFVCNRISLFEDSFSYRLAIEFFRQSKYSTELSRYTLIDSSVTDEQIAELKEDYERKINSLFEDLDVPDDGTCFICNKLINDRVLLP